MIGLAEIVWTYAGNVKWNTWEIWEKEYNITVSDSKHLQNHLISFSTDELSRPMNQLEYFQNTYQIYSDSIYAAGNNSTDPNNYKTQMFVSTLVDFFVATILLLGNSEFQSVWMSILGLIVAAGIGVDAFFSWKIFKLDEDTFFYLAEALHLVLAALIVLSYLEIIIRACIGKERSFIEHRYDIIFIYFDLLIHLLQV
jgi:hypothetical protein